MNSRSLLQGRVALITGASSGIGKCTALALAQRGVNLALAARREGALQEVAHRARAFGVEAEALPTDVTSREQAERFVQAALDRWGRADILVTCAGAYVRAHATRLTVADVERSMAVNFYGTLYPLLAVLPHMLARKQGHLIMVTSLDGKKGLPLDAPYVAAKAAVGGLAESIRQDLRGSGVAVTAVFPGRVDTPLIESLRVPAISAKIPPERVADAIVRALHRRPPEVILPPQGRLLHCVNVVSPRLGDWFVRLFHLEGWETTPGSDADLSDGPGSPSAVSSAS
ncbi:MAG: SDR family NAD(P)-dependent oxidoreductase [Anaerolineae bacterium]|nr:SDR family NAD(P)-dependent oxidoreductase [Anaerolineae bacterium]